MTFGAVFQRPFPPVFDRGLDAAAAAAGWWTYGGATGCVAAYQPKGAASLAASYVNLANPGTYDAAPGVAPTFDAATGWSFAAAASQYLNSGVPGTSALSMLIRFSNASGALVSFGAAIETGGTKYILWRPRNTTNRQLYLASSSLIKAGALTSGVFGYAGATVFLNGLSDGSVLPMPSLPAGLPGIAIYIGALNFAGTAAQFSGINVQAVAIYSDTLSAGEVATVSSAMAAL